MRRMFQFCLNRWKNKCIYLSLAIYYTTDVFISRTEIGIDSVLHLGLWSSKEVQGGLADIQNNVLDNKPISGMEGKLYFFNYNS